MSGKISEPKSRKEYDQIKREKMSNKKPVSSNEGLVKKCKKIIQRKNS